MSKNTPVQAKKKESYVSLLVAILVALSIRTFLYEPFTIPSGSMINTLLIGDYLFVNKFTYGFGKWSFPFGFVPLSERVFATSPKQGDVVVFRTDLQPGKDFVKRVIGLPGDVIKVQQGRLYVNGKALPIVEDGKVTYEDENGQKYEATRYVEELPNGVKHPIVIDDPMGSQHFDNTASYTVPEGHYFMMGDHRQRSDDSRNLKSMGFIPDRNIVGRASFIFFSLDKSKGGWWKIWEWPVRIRYNRLFTFVR